MEKLQILWVSKTYAAPGAAVKMHQHPYYHMFYICCSSKGCSCLTMLWLDS